VISFGRHRHLAALAMLALASPAAARLRVCTFAFNGPEEVDVFRTRLPPEDFEIVDLSPALATPVPTPGGTVSWADNLCPTDLRCDVVVYSAEFGGRFFGRSGRSVSLQELEEASCQPRCAGLFHTPQEVFLLACNTLATKDQDTRTPAQYREVLLDHGFEQADAERAVAIRYGPLGQSFREAERRIFAGVPRLYGFSTVAQNARTTLNAGIQKLGKTPDIYTNQAQWTQIFGGMDRRSLYAVSSNEGGQFSTTEQQLASGMMDAQLSKSMGNASTGSSTEDEAAFERGIAFLQNASPEEKQSVAWAMNMASAKTSYNNFAADLGQPAQDATYTSPLVKVLMAAMKAAQYDPSKDRSFGQQNTLAEIKNQPWAQGFESQIDQAYAATAPPGNLLNMQA